MCSSLVVAGVQERAHRRTTESTCAKRLCCALSSDCVNQTLGRQSLDIRTYLENSLVNFRLTRNGTSIQLATLRRWTHNPFTKKSLSFHFRKPGTNLIWNAIRHHCLGEIIQKCNSFPPTAMSTLIPRQFCSIKAHWVCTVNFTHYKRFLWQSGLANPGNDRSLGRSCGWNVPPRCEMINGKWPSTSGSGLQ